MIGCGSSARNRARSSPSRVRGAAIAPEKIICVGVNYGNRNAEYKDGSDLPKYPSIFLRFPGSLVNPVADEKT